MECLKDFRLNHGYSKKQMADILQISNSLYEKIEYGIRQPSRNFLCRFKSVFPNFDMNIFLILILAQELRTTINLFRQHSAAIIFFTLTFITAAVVGYILDDYIWSNIDLFRSDAV